MNTFLNPLGRPPATTSAVIRTQPRHGSNAADPPPGNKHPPLTPAADQYRPQFRLTALR